MSIVVVTHVKIEPNDCDLGAPLQLDITFDAQRPLHNVQWRFSYARDLIGARNEIVELCRAAAVDYGVSAHSSCHAQRVTCTVQLVGDAPNCGVLRCALHDGAGALNSLGSLREGGEEGERDAAGAELYRLGLVCQVTADEATGRLRRVVHSPLGEDD